jgi:anthranilate phosphoribosyltransferase
MSTGRTAVAAAVELAATGAPLPGALAEAAMEELMDGVAPATQVAALLALLHLRGETAEELAAFARVMRSRAVDVDAPEEAVDLCVEALGIVLDPGPEVVARSIRETGFGFMFAPAYHPAMKHAMPIRRELPIRTIFNLLGPLSSPAGVRRQLLGVADPGLLELVAGALARLDVERALVVHGADGLDELTLAGPNRALLVEGTSVTRTTVDPAALGLPHADRQAMIGGDAQLNSAIAILVLGGEPGPARDVVLLNASAALFVAGVAADLAEGIIQAAESIDSGRAAEVVTASAGIAG